MFMRNHHALICFLVAIVLSGLAAAKTTITPENYIYIDKDGFFESRCTGNRMTDVADIGNEIHTLLGSDHTETLVVFIHGGLNHREASKARARLFENALPESMRAVFINWNSGMISSIGEHLLTHRAGAKWEFAGPLTMPFVLISDVGSGAARIPVNMVALANTTRKTWDFRAKYSGENAYKNDEMYNGSYELGPQSTRKNERRTGLTVFANSIWSIVTHTLAVPAQCFLGGFGPGAWDVMKSRVESMFYNSRTIDHKDYGSHLEFYDLKRGCMIQLLDSLVERQKSQKLILAGHSMGSLVVNRMLTARPELEYERIIYMGAACSIREFQDTVQPYLANHARTQFYNYMLDPLAENSEAPLWGVLGAGSLLVQIDDMYERPVSQNRRTMGRWENSMNAINCFMTRGDGVVPLLDKPSPMKRTHMVTLPFEPKFLPTHHGDFSKSELTGNWKLYLDDQYRESRLSQSGKCSGRSE